MAKTKEKERKRVSGKKRAVEHKSGYDRTTFILPDGVHLFRLDKAGTKRIEIIPYKVGKGNPYADEGELHYERTYFIHRNIGVNEDSFCSLKKTFGKPCPIDEALRKLQQNPDADEDAVKALRTSERQLFNVFDHGDPEKGVQVWDMTYHWFGKLLDNRIKNQDDDDGYEFFADPEEGMTLRLTIEESSFAKGKYEVVAIDFKPRKKPLSDELLDAALCLDDLLVEKTYDELKAIFLQIDDPNDKKSKGKGKAKDDEDDDDDEEDEDEKPKAKSKAKPVRKPADDDDDDDDDDDSDDSDGDDDDEDEDDEPKQKPKSKSKAKPEPKGKSKSKKSDDDDDEDDEDDDEDNEDDEDDEPAPKSKSKAKPESKGKSKSKPEPKSKSKAKKADDDDEDEDEDEDFDGGGDDDWEEDED